MPQSLLDPTLPDSPGADPKWMWLDLKKQKKKLVREGHMIVTTFVLGSSTRDKGTREQCGSQETQVHILAVYVLDRGFNGPDTSVVELG